MGPPMIIGAGLGALTSVAMGKSPFTGALLGGATGGMFGGAGGFGSGFGLGEGGLLSGMQGVATTPVSMGTGGFASGIGGQVIPNAITSVAPTVAETALPNLPTSFMNEYVPQNLVTQGTELPVSTVASQPATYAEGIQDVYRPQFENISRGASEGFTGGGYNPNGGLFGGIKDMFGGLSTKDKLSMGLQGYQAVNQPQQMIQPVQGQIRQGNPNPSSPVFKVAPNITSSALKDMMAHIPYTEEDLMRLQQLGYRG